MDVDSSPWYLLLQSIRAVVYGAVVPSVGLGRYARLSAADQRK